MAEALLEVCPVCGSTMKAGRYICPQCERNPTRTQMVLIADEPEYTPKRYRGKLDGSICGFCPMLEKCKERIANGGWCYCEVPSEEDVMIVELEGH